MPEISHATVYNCLDALVKCGLVRQVQLERGATRFCPNMEEHCHYSCDACGEVFDVRVADGFHGHAAAERFQSGSLRHRRSRPLRGLREDQMKITININNSR